MLAQTGSLGAEIAARSDIEHLLMEAGEVVLLHNHLLHSSGVNRTPQSRRAFCVCYMEAATVCSSGATFPVVFGGGALAA